MPLDEVEMVGYVTEALAHKASPYRTFQPRLNRVHLPRGAGASEAGQQQQGGVICAIPFAASPFHHLTLTYAAIFPDMHTGLAKERKAGTCNRLFHMRMQASCRHAHDPLNRTRDRTVFGSPTCRGAIPRHTVQQSPRASRST